MAYYGVEPWGPERTDLGFGIVASTLANIHRDPRKSDPFTPSDFMAKWGPEPEPEDEEEEDGMAPEKVMAVMERMMERQERREKELKGNGSVA
jgi:Ser/Thr protein kinase RdoA (MazF antagonist)